MKTMDAAVAWHARSKRHRYEAMCLNIVMPTGMSRSPARKGSYCSAARRPAANAIRSAGV